MSTWLTVYEKKKYTRVTFSYHESLKYFQLILYILLGTFMETLARNVLDVAFMINDNLKCFDVKFLKDNTCTGIA